MLLIDLPSGTGWPLAAARLLDTLLGCGIVLLIGYAPWPTSWYAHLPGQFASTVSAVCEYLEQALVARSADRRRLRRRAYRGLSDLRTEFQRTMSEPRGASRRATLWWPAVVGLEQVMDAATATAVGADHGAPLPPSACVQELAAAAAYRSGGARGHPAAGAGRAAGRGVRGTGGRRRVPGAGGPGLTVGTRRAAGGRHKTRPKPPAQDRRRRRHKDPRQVIASAGAG